MLILHIQRVGNELEVELEGSKVRDLAFNDPTAI